jgi:hypothetical protein
MRRRRNERFDLEIPLNFSWKDPEGVHHRAKGVVRNISGAGVFISTYDTPPVNTRVRFNLSFRSFLAGSRLVMQTNAQVLRVEPNPRIDAAPGFAAAIKTYTLRNEKEIIK